MEHRRNSPFLLLFSMALALLLGGCVAVVQTPPVRADLVDYQKNSDSVYRLDVVSRGGHGSGTVISKEGHILTVAHVAGAGDLSVILWEDGKDKPVTYPAAVIGLNYRHDLAIVRIERKFDVTGRIGKVENLHPGDEVYNIGYPYEFGEMVARGHVMRLHYTVPEDPNDKSPEEEKMVIEDNVLADFLAAPGTSGSGVFLSKTGELVGVMRLLAAQGFSVSTLMVTRGFVPLNQIVPFIEKLRVPYVQVDGTVKQYAPLPPPRKTPKEAAPEKQQGPGPAITPLPSTPPAPTPGKKHPGHKAGKHSKDRPAFQRAF